MTEEEFKEISKQLEDHEKRIHTLEGFSKTQAIRANPREGKQMTLREIVRGRKFKNGQEQIAVIVGYHENIIGQLIHKEKIKTEWVNAKMTNKYNTNFLRRVKDELIRIHPNGTCDLTQSGEKFFENFLENESSQKASK